VRAVDCWCGQVVHGEDDEELVGRLRGHVDEEHAGEQRTDDDVRGRITERAYEPPTGEPPWAY
jgi:predicted small metal-binding protein